MYFCLLEIRDHLFYSVHDICLSILLHISFCHVYTVNVGCVNVLGSVNYQQCHSIQLSNNKA